MSGRLRVRIASVAVVSACGFSATNLNDLGGGTRDAAVDAVVVDAGSCVAVSAECVSNNERLRQCAGAGQQPIDTICGWGCSDAPMPHCQRLTPSGGALTVQDLDGNPALVDVTIAGATVVLDTDTGEISGVRGAGLGVVSGIEYAQRGTVGVFRFNRLRIDSELLSIRGTRAAAIVSITDVEINGEINVQGECATLGTSPGGATGGADRVAGGGGAAGGGPGAGGNTSCSGGGGGGHGGTGGNGGNASNRGGFTGDALIAALVGGGGGGGGGGSNGGDGGNGGGAIQLAANGPIVIDGISPLRGGINAGGCGGKGADACGGGGGAGGAILIEAPLIVLDGARLAVNGGGGGGGGGEGNSGQIGQAGERAQLSTAIADGGNGGNASGNGEDGGDGGDGGDDGSLNGRDGQDRTRGGGGGGGVGRIRFNTLSGMITRNGLVILSPALSDTEMTTPVTQGKAAIE